MKKRIWIPLLVLALLVIVLCFAGSIKENYEEDFISVKSEKNFKSLVNSWDGTLEDENTIKTIGINLLLAPWNIISGDYYGEYRFYGSRHYNRGYDSIDMLTSSLVEESSTDVMINSAPTTSSKTSSALPNTINIAGLSDGTTTGSKGKSEEKQDNFSTTNIQVENVDEADVIKTDGNFIYSFSDMSVVITDAKKMKVVSKIEEEGLIPEDMILHNDKLVVIFADFNNNEGTSIYTYDITNKNVPDLKSRSSIDGSYYTSRRINNDVFVISSSYLYDDFEPVYMFNGQLKNIDYKALKYQRGNITDCLTYITSFNITNCEEEPKINGYLMDISEAYVSENNIYIMNQDYGYDYDEPEIKDMFGPWGILGIFINGYSEDNDYGAKTEIRKFRIKDGEIEYDCKGKINGRTINQFSFDEYDSMFRVAITNDNTNGVVILDKKLNKVGELTGLAEGERIYSSRFIGNRLYLVTYKNTDPLFVIDLADAKNPKVLGELKISGFSSYLHPYDENHIIGIGRETEEVVNKDSFGRVRSTWAINQGLKMALFDVSDVANPKQLSKVTIGDSRTYSNILENHKALLFSKEKNLMAIPVNGYDEEIQALENDNDIIERTYNYNRSGFIVYNITLEKGFVKKGTIMHDAASKNRATWYWYRNNSPVRGLYIGDVLYTVSDEQIFANKLNDLKLVKKIDLKTIEEEE